MYGIGLDNPKFSTNVGSVLRAAGNFGAGFVAIRGQRFKHQRAPTNKSQHQRHMPVFQCDDLHTMIPYGCVPVGVDLVDHAENIITYEHPKNAFYVFGAEDATLGERVLGWCRDVIYVPTHHCMNLSGAVHVVLYDRMRQLARGL